MKLESNSNSLVVYSDNYLRFLTIQGFGQDFHQDKIDLVFSGKKMIFFERSVGVVEADPSYENSNTNSPQKIED